MRTWVFIVAAVLTAALMGCRQPSRTPWDNLREAQQKNTELSLRVQSLEKENEQLSQQVKTLSRLDPNVRLSELDTASEIKLHRMTGLYDRNGDGKPDTLVVYLQTMDAQQDFVKAPGRCAVELWDLGAAAESKIGTWTIEPAELQKLWGGTIFNQYYRIEIPLNKIPPTGTDLTVRAVFTELVTGKVLTSQITFRTINRE
ncbi:MAG: hypothetical protein LLF76_06450 [Planctomycetaceae bacterium]|nr:hypothetical protein [Planctomycetaceae bacterium]